MDIGFFSYNTEYGIRADDLAKELEARGFDSLWVGEHTHIPASRETPFPGGGDLPKPYYHMSDPFVTLGMAAAVTENLKLGTGISLVVEHDPIAIVTADVIHAFREGDSMKLESFKFLGITSLGIERPSTQMFAKRKRSI